jgi:transcriptional regulator with XRE-family HTH domain
MATARKAIPAMESMMTPEQIHMARAAADAGTLSLRLAKLRERKGINQSDIGGFSQTSISKLESRKDIKVSTLIEYLDGLDMGIEIRAVPKGTSKRGKGEILLKV